MSTKISIIVPVYNPGKYFSRCVESLLNQTYLNLEIFLVDDGSTDGSEKMCDEFALKDRRVISIHQKNSGVSAARNKGIENCSGDFIHFMDSDDYLEPDTYEKLIVCQSTYNCDVVVCEYYVDYPAYSFQHKNDMKLYQLCTGEEAATRLFSGFQFAWNKLFSQKLIKGDRCLPGIRFREDIYRGEDTLFAAEAFLRAKTVYYMPQAAYHYVQSEESACRGRFRESQLSILKLYDAYHVLYDAYGSTIPLEFWGYLHDNLIMIYYDMWSDETNHADGQLSIRKALKHYYPKASWAAGHNHKRKIKFMLASYFPKIFCVVHKVIHRL